MSPYQKRYRQKSGAADFNWHTKNRTGSKSKALETPWRSCSEHLGLYKEHAQKKICPRTKKGTVENHAPDLWFGTSKHNREHIFHIGYTLEQMFDTSLTHKDHPQKKICPRTKKGTVKNYAPDLWVGTSKHNREHTFHIGYTLEQMFDISWTH